MIRVRRGVTPTSLDGPDSNGQVERGKAIAHYQDPAWDGKAAYDFAAYKRDDVKAALHAAFRGKCAYCESVYAGTQPMDVEHFRPKGAVWVDGQLRKPGYYWLAAEWDNLLPSCIDCNRSRTQEVPDGPAGALGKANQFPIAREADRATGPNGERGEERLLIHPCRDWPEVHLEFGEEGIVRPGLTSSGEERAKGTASIKVYGLQRTGLVEARRDRRTLILALMRRISRIAELVDAYPEDVNLGDVLGEILTQDLSDLRAFTGDGQPFAAMARQLIEPFVADLIGEAPSS